MPPPSSLLIISASSSLLPPSLSRSRSPPSSLSLSRSPPSSLLPPSPVSASSRFLPPSLVSASSRFLPPSPSPGLLPPPSLSRLRLLPPSLSRSPPPPPPSSLALPVSKAKLVYLELVSNVGLFALLWSASSFGGVLLLERLRQALSQVFWLCTNKSLSPQSERVLGWGVMLEMPRIVRAWLGTVARWPVSPRLIGDRGYMAKQSALDWGPSRSGQSVRAWLGTEAYVASQSALDWGLSRSGQSVRA
ncbi:hypothetical protein ACLB2K_041539 [Fragaria x ananassa]